MPRGKHCNRSISICIVFSHAFSVVRYLCIEKRLEKAFLPENAVEMRKSSIYQCNAICTFCLRLRACAFFSPVAILSKMNRFFSRSIVLNINNSKYTSIKAQRNETVYRLKWKKRITRDENYQHNREIWAKATTTTKRNTKHPNETTCAEKRNSRSIFEFVLASFSLSN